jgi:PrtD family type I secretion system ABC transporter
MKPGVKTKPSKLIAVLKTCRVAFVSLAVFSFVSNALLLTGPLYMLQIYDRVLNSGSVPTLVALTILVAILFGLYGFLEFIRSRVLVRVSRIFEESLRDRIFDLVSFHALMQTPNVRLAPMQDMQTIRQFLQSPGPLAFFDMPWSPFYIAVIFLLHPVLGLFSVVATIILIITAIINDRLTRHHAQEAQQAAVKASSLSDEARRNVEVATVLGMLGVLRARWTTMQNAAMDALTLSSDRGGMLTSLSKGMRLMFQSAILGIGAYLAVKQEVSPGTMIAASIIMSRALQPVEMAVSQWAGFQSFRRAWVRLDDLLAETPEQTERMALPAPTGALKAENLIGYIPGVERPIVAGISFELQPGTGLGIIGPTGAGKSTLARLLVGLWPHKRGTVRLDGASLDQWDPRHLGQFYGYLPQEVELFDGTIGQNIARFTADARPEDVVTAAQEARAHDFVLNMPNGYNTVIGEGGQKLSAGERQRVGLARALYGNPVVVVLDEPNANLDADGENALLQAIANVRRRGGTVIVVAHRPSAIAALDQLMVLKAGRPVAYGPRDEVLKKVLARPVSTSGKPGGLSVVSDEV